MKNLELQVLRSYEELVRIRCDWDRLAELQADALLEFDWFYHCARSFYAEEDLRVVVSKRDGRITGIAPLILAGTGFRRYLEIIGNSHLFEPTGILMESPSDLAAIVERLHSFRYPIRLQRLALGSPGREILRSIPSWKMITVFREGDGVSILNIVSDWESYERSLKKTRKEKLKKWKKILGETGASEYMYLAPVSEELAPILKAAFDVEASGWKKDTGTAVLMNKPIKEFFLSYCAAAAETGALRVCFLKVGGNPIATQIMVEKYGKLYELKIGYDECYSRLAPGILVKHETIRQAFDKRLSAYEFLGAIEPQVHGMWTRDRRPLVSIRYYPWNVFGISNLLMDGKSAVRNRFHNSREYRAGTARKP